MKIVGFLVAVFSVFFVNGQNSYYFAEPLPTASMKVNSVAEKYFGSYAINNGTLEMQFDATGITLVSVTVGSISRETVRESSKYNVRNGFIFGVEVGDSVPCVLNEEHYYFGIRNHDEFVGATSKNVLTKTNDPAIYVLNVFENGRYVPQLLHFKGNKLVVSHFDYSGETTDEFGYIVSQETLQLGGLNLVILKPENSDFDRIKSQAFEETMVLKK